ADGFWSELKSLFWHQEEPFSSTSVYAQWCVMRLALQNDVTVLLDGQGADEMLAGYHAYFDVMADDLLRNFSLTSYYSWRKKCLELHGVAPGSLKRVLIQSVPRKVKDSVKVIRDRRASVAKLDPLIPSYPSHFKNVSGLRKLLWWNTTRQGLVELL